MWFNSLHFAAFFLVVMPSAIALARKVRVRNAFLLLASYYFYGTSVRSGQRRGHNRG